MPVRRSGRTAKPSQRALLAQEAISLKPLPKEKTKNFTLNKKKALEKKLKLCHTDTKISCEAKGGNIIYKFSTGLFELYKAAAIHYFTSKAKDHNYPHAIQIETPKDQLGSILETIIWAKTKRSKGGGTTRFTLTLYNTTCKALLNGKTSELYFADHHNIIDLVLQTPAATSIDAVLHEAISTQLAMMDPATQQPSLNSLPLEAPSMGTPRITHPVATPMDRQPAITGPAPHCASQESQHIMTHVSTPGTARTSPHRDTITTPTADHRETLHLEANYREAADSDASMLLSPVFQDPEDQTPPLGVTNLDPPAPMSQEPDAEQIPTRQTQLALCLQPTSPQRHHTRSPPEELPISIPPHTSTQQGFTHGTDNPLPKTVRNKTQTAQKKKTAAGKKDFQLTDQEKQLAACRTMVTQLEDKNRELERTVRTLQIQLANNSATPMEQGQQTHPIHPHCRCRDSSHNPEIENLKLRMEMMELRWEQKLMRFELGLHDGPRTTAAGPTPLQRQNSPPEEPPQPNPVGTHGPAQDDPNSRHRQSSKSHFLTHGRKGNGKRHLQDQQNGNPSQPKKKKNHPHQAPPYGPQPAHQPPLGQHPLLFQAPHMMWPPAILHQPPHVFQKPSWTHLHQPPRQSSHAARMKTHLPPTPGETTHQEPHTLRRTASPSRLAH